MMISDCRLRTVLLAGVALTSLAACNRPIDFDLRSFGDGFSTSEAALNAAGRPAPDARGVITYPNYQVALAQDGDTVRTLAARLGVDAGALAAHNGLAADAALRRDEVVALPAGLTAAPSVTAPATVSPDVTALAGAALDRAGTVTTGALPPATAPAAAPALTPVGPEPIRHQVVAGETVYIIARRYNVPVRAIAEWNALGPDLAIREGQQLLVPRDGTGGAPVAEEEIAVPGAGSATPVPPSATEALPPAVPPAAEAAEAAATAPSPAPDLGAEQAAAPASAFVRPVSGSIIRAYAPGRNEGIDIGASAGTEVRAAAAGTVAAVTTNTEGIQIVVIKHAGDLLSVYTHVDNLTVAKDATVTQGQVIGRVRAGDPSFLHFEIRRGMQSQDPTEFLP
jgi:lipoprotein NlpD